MAPFKTPVLGARPTGVKRLITGILYSLVEAATLFSLVVMPWQPVNMAATPKRDPVKVSPDSLQGTEQVAHLLNRLTYGARPGDIDRVQEMGVRNFIEQQLHPESIPDPGVEQKLADLETLNMSSPELAANFPPPNIVKQLRAQQQAMAGPEMPAPEETSPPLPPGKQRRLQQFQSAVAQNPGQKPEGPRKIIVQLQQAKVLRAVYSQRQLYEEMVDFWENHFNIFAAKGADKWLLTEYDRDVIRPNVMGKFKDLVEATAHSPAMLFYLDNWLSVDPNAPQNQARRNRPLFRNRRFAQRSAAVPANQNPQQVKRGLNENYARELMELHTLGVEGGYTQKDVTEVARCFTGWTIRAPRQGGGFFFNPRLHDNGVKIVLGHKIQTGGERDGEEVINILVHHPSTARFIARELVTRFVSDNPPPPLVERVADTYLKTDGDIREMLRTIFYSPEFNSLQSYRSKVKSPFELVVSAIRTSAGDTNASLPLVQFIARMGQPLFMYQAPTGYPDRASEWLNSGTLLTRMNFALAFAANRIPGTNVNLAGLLADLPPGQTEAMRQRLIDVFLQGDAGERTRAALKKDDSALTADSTVLQATALPVALNQALTVETAGLILGSPEFQRR